VAKPSLLGALGDKDADMPPDSDAGGGADMDDSDPKVQAAQSVLDAVESKDAEALSDALSAFSDMHSSPPGDDMSPNHKPKLVIAIGHGPSK
jgi:hypothetical protein